MFLIIRTYNILKEENNNNLFHQHFKNIKKF